jgi:hypothetical protein
MKEMLAAMKADWRVAEVPDMRAKLAEIETTHRGHEGDKERKKDLFRSIMRSLDNGTVILQETFLTLLCTRYIHKESLLNELEADAGVREVANYADKLDPLRDENVHMRTSLSVHTKGPVLTRHAPCTRRWTPSLLCSW